MKKASFLFLVCLTITLVACRDKERLPDDSVPHEVEIDGYKPLDSVSSKRFPPQAPTSSTIAVSVSSSTSTGTSGSTTKAILDKYAAAMAAGEMNQVVDCISPKVEYKEFVQGKVNLAIAIMNFTKELKIEHAGLEDNSSVAIGQIPHSQMVLLPEVVEGIEVTVAANVGTLPAPYDTVMELRNEGGEWFVELKDIPENDQARGIASRKIRKSTTAIEALREQIKSGGDKDELIEGFTEILTQSAEGEDEAEGEGEAGVTEEDDPTIPTVPTIPGTDGDAAADPAGDDAADPVEPDDGEIE